MIQVYFQRHWPALIIPLLCLCAQQLWPDGNSPLIYYTSHSTLSQLPALLGSTLLHTNLNHLIMNLAAYGLIYFYSTQSLQSWRMFVVTFVCGVAATWGFALSPTQLSSLVGLSGALHGCMIYLAICEFKQAPKLMTVTLAGVTGKIIWEQLIGPSPHTEALIGASVAIWSHLSGAIGGGVLALLTMIWQRKKSAASWPS